MAGPEWPLIVPNTICLVISGFILTMVLLPSRHRRAVATLLDPGAVPEGKTNDS